MTKQHNSANDADIGSETVRETVYEHLLRIEKLTYSAELLADSFSDLQRTGAPPIEYLLSLANQEIRALAFRVSD
jgi:hypothetical protein